MSPGPFTTQAELLVLPARDRSLERIVGLVCTKMSRYAIPDIDKATAKMAERLRCVEKAVERSGYSTFAAS
ncbi:hypothetical protein PTI98_000002 [Pleurotus ostreatus]|nr:hypothetical protein PTI98_000002 [Pleurotus ostreatus]